MKIKSNLTLVCRGLMFPIFLVFILWGCIRLHVSLLPEQEINLSLQVLFPDPHHSPHAVFLKDVVHVIPNRVSSIHRRNSSNPKEERVTKEVSFRQDGAQSRDTLSSASSGFPSTGYLLHYRLSSEMLTQNTFGFGLNQWLFCLGRGGMWTWVETLERPLELGACF